MFLKVNESYYYWSKIRHFTPRNRELFDFGPREKDFYAPNIDLILAEFPRNHIMILGCPHFCIFYLDVM